MSSCDVLIVFTTFANVEDARRVVRSLVEERLAACGTVLPGAMSIYQWQGAIHEEPEVQVLLKTSAERVEALQSRLVDLHPYETPEFFALPAGQVYPAYGDWLAKAVS